MSNPLHMIPYDEMRPKVDLMIEEMREMTEFLVQFRDHDFGRELDRHVWCPNVFVGCRVGVVPVDPPPPPPPPGSPCQGFRHSVDWNEALEAAEHLMGALVTAMRQLRRPAGNDSLSGEG